MPNLLLNDPWEPPTPPSDDMPCKEVDPRVDARHEVGVLPCPPNPPAPVGWAYWRGAVPAAATQFATRLLHDAAAYRMGCFVQILLDSSLVGARVEWHTFQGATGKKGCFRGVSLMQPIATAHPSGATPLSHPASAARGSFGVDSLNPVTLDAVELAKQVLGQTPLFWGRYLSTTTTRGKGEYRHRAESPALSAERIYLLLIARQTTHVAGSVEEGIADGRANAADLVATFAHDWLVAQGGEFFVFLDVEGDEPQPSLSAAYYRGWCQGLTSIAPAIKLRPCVYAPQVNQATWRALEAAVAAGATCAGLWVAHWRTLSGIFPLTPDWSSHETTPHTTVSAPVLLWQYAGDACDGRLDCSQTNPALDLENEFLRYLILPA
jgi:hypothetical protein